MNGYEQPRTRYEGSIDVFEGFRNGREHRRTVACPSHGENRGSSPLGSAIDFNHLTKTNSPDTLAYGKSTAYPGLISRKKLLTAAKQFADLARQGRRDRAARLSRPPIAVSAAKNFAPAMSALPPKADID